MLNMYTCKVGLERGLLFLHMCVYSLVLPQLDFRLNLRWGLTVAAIKDEQPQYLTCPRFLAGERGGALNCRVQPKLFKLCFIQINFNILTKILKHISLHLFQTLFFFKKMKHINKH